jgi:hypothetical protein
MKYLVVLLLTLPLQGCWFFFLPIPTSLFQAGNTCAGENVYAGQRLRHDDGRVGTVVKVIGRHQLCQTSNRPMLLEVNYEDVK